MLANYVNWGDLQNDFYYLEKSNLVIFLYIFFAPQVFINNTNFQDTIQDFSECYNIIFKGSNVQWNFHLDHCLVNDKSPTPFLIFIMALEMVWFLNMANDRLMYDSKTFCSFLGRAPGSIYHFFYPSVHPLCTISQEQHSI